MKKIFTILGLVAISSMNAQIVINEIYVGGGNTNALYPNDFVELINSGTTEQTLSGAYLQYAAPSKTFNSAVSLPDVTLKPQQTFLIRLGKGKNDGTQDFKEDHNALEAFNIDPNSKSFGKIFNTSINLGRNGKLALTNTKEQISDPDAKGVLDFVGWGTANQYEGEKVSAITENNKSISRTNGIDTNNNKADFKKGNPTPQNKEDTKLSTNEIGNKNVFLIKNTVVEHTLTFGENSIIKIYNTNGQLIKSIEAIKNKTIDVSYLPKGVYIISGEIHGKVITQKVIKK